VSQQEKVQNDNLTIPNNPSLINNLGDFTGSPVSIPVEILLAPRVIEKILAYI